MALPDHLMRIEDWFGAHADEAREIARDRLRGEWRGGTLDSVALVGEACLRLLSGESPPPMADVTIRAWVSQTMGSVLMDAARRHHAQKRGGGAPAVTLSSALEGHAATPATSLLTSTLADLLIQLEEVSPERAWVARCRLFGDMWFSEIAAASAETPGIARMSTDTAERRWRQVKVWLGRRLEKSG